MCCKWTRYACKAVEVSQEAAYQHSHCKLRSPRFESIIGQRDQRQIAALHGHRRSRRRTPRVLPPLHWRVPPSPRLCRCRVARALLVVVDLCMGKNSRGCVLALGADWDRPRAASVGWVRGCRSRRWKERADTAQRRLPPDRWSSRGVSAMKGTRGGDGGGGGGQRCATKAAIRT